MKDFKQKLDDALFVISWKIDSGYPMRLSITKEYLIRNYNIRTPEKGCSIGKVYVKD